MYEHYFNLRVKPFDLTPNPDFIYLSRSHRKALTFIDYGIRERAGFILLTGDVGSGKTTIIRDLLQKNYERVVLAKLFNTKVNSEQLLAMINDEYGLPVQGKDKITLIRELNSYLIEQYAQGNQPILIIDEAQNLGPELLEEIRMLSNLETSDSKLLQIILVGQPELRKTLAAPALLQLRQRISINCNLKPLTREEVEHYIVHRLHVAGNAEAVTFAAEAIEIIFKHSRGIPRLINIMCDFLMLSAFAEQTHQISQEMASEVVGDLDCEHHFWASEDDWGILDLSESVVPTDSKSAKISHELEQILGEISQRLVRIEEKSVPIFDDSSLKELNYRISALQNAFKYHVGETETLFTEFSRKLEQVRKDSSPSGSALSGSAQDGNGRVRKLPPPR